MFTQKRTRSIGAVGLTLLLVSSLGAAPAHAVPVNGGTEIITGTLRDSKGMARSDARVVALAWPKNEDLAAMRPGETGRLVPIAWSSTDGSGRFYFTEEQFAEVRDKFADQSGNVNLTLLSSNGTGETAQTAVSLPVRDGLSHESASADLSYSPSVAQDLPPALAAKRPAEPTQPAALVDCEFLYLSNLGKAWATIGRHWATGVNATHQLTFTAGASATLGVGMSQSGNYGSYSASGTASVSTQSTIGFSSSTGSRDDRTEMTYGKYQYVCWTPGYPTYFYARPTAVAGGTQLGASAVPTANYCTAYSAGSWLEKSTTAATTTSLGAATVPLIGISLSAQSGYTANTKLKFTFNESGRLCGTSGYPASAPGLLVAKK